MPGARCTRSLACKIKKHTSVVTTGSPERPGIPCAMVLTVSFALSPVTGLFCHRRLADRSTRLDASVGASGPHDFTVRDRIIRPRANARLTLPRPPHPAPTFVTMANAPLFGTELASSRFDLGQRRSGIFLQAGLDSQVGDLPVRQTSCSPKPWCGRAARADAAGEDVLL
jgi:hypothetical protein